MILRRLTTTPSLARSRVLATLLLLLGLMPIGFGQAAFDAQRYYLQCLNFEQSGDLETARLSCINAITADPSFAAANLALGRIELELGHAAAAESALQRAGRTIDSAELHQLRARLYIENGRYGEAEAALSNARQRLAGTDGDSQEAAQSYLWGELERRRGRFDAAVNHFNQALAIDPGNLRNVLALASLQFEMGDLKDTNDTLETYLSRFGDPNEPQLNSLLGWTLWAEGDLSLAAQQLERAMQLRGGGYGEAQANDLRALGLIYYGMGDLQAGGLALREAATRGNLFDTFLAGNLGWVLLLLLLLAVHLIGESRVGGRPPGDTDANAMWTVGQVYGIALIALLLAVPLATAYGVVRYDNFLALLTPVQSGDTRAVLFIAFSLIVAWGAWRTVGRRGWYPKQALLSGPDKFGSGVLLGILMLLLTFVYRAYLPPLEWLGDHFLDLAHLTSAAAVALIVIPVSEIYFRAFAFPAFEARYGTAIAVLVSGSLWALIFATPAPLLLALGLILSIAFQRTRSGTLTLTAQVTLHWGLLVAVLLIPWARSLFI